MNINKIILGTLCLLIGLYALYYVEGIRKKGNLDGINFKGYIGGITLVGCGLYLIIYEIY